MNPTIPEILEETEKLKAGLENSTQELTWLFENAPRCGHPLCITDWHNELRQCLNTIEYFEKAIAIQDARLRMEASAPNSAQA